MSGTLFAHFSSLSVSKVFIFLPFSHFFLICARKLFFFLCLHFFSSFPLHCSYKSRLPHFRSARLSLHSVRPPPSFFSSTTANTVQCLLSSPFTFQLLPPVCNPFLFFRFHAHTLPPLCNNNFFHCNDSKEQLVKMFLSTVMTKANIFIHHAKILDW